MTNSAFQFGIALTQTSYDHMIAETAVASAYTIGDCDDTDAYWLVNKAVSDM